MAEAACRSINAYLAGCFEIFPGLCGIADVCSAESMHIWQAVSDFQGLYGVAGFWFAGHA